MKKYVYLFVVYFSLHNVAYSMEADLALHVHNICILICYQQYAMHQLKHFPENPIEAILYHKLDAPDFHTQLFQHDFATLQSFSPYIARRLLTCLAPIKSLSNKRKQTISAEVHDRLWMMEETMKDFIQTHSECSFPEETEQPEKILSPAQQRSEWMVIRAPELWQAQCTPAHLKQLDIEYQIYQRQQNMKALNEAKKAVAPKKESSSPCSMM